MPSNNTFIIRLNEKATDSELKETIERFKRDGGKVKHEHPLIKGFSGEIPDDKAHILDSLPHVASVEKDSKVHAN